VKPSVRRFANAHKLIVHPSGHNRWDGYTSRLKRPFLDYMMQRHGASTHAWIHGVDGNLFWIDTKCRPVAIKVGVFFIVQFV
jgi:hypothetical protein